MALVRAANLCLPMIAISPMQIFPLYFVITFFILRLCSRGKDKRIMRVPFSAQVIVLSALLVSAAAAVAAPSDAARNALDTCSTDIEKFCGTGTTGRAARECVRKNLEKLSPDCRQAVNRARGAGRTEGNDDGSGNANEQSAASPTRADVIYRTPPAGVPASALSLDYFAAPGSKKAPLVVFVHGGGWQIGDKRGGEHGHPQALNAAGYAYASVNYRLLQYGPPDVAASDIAAAIAFLRAHANEYGFDPDRIALMGHSAGAHLAALVGLDSRYLATSVPRTAIRSLVLLDGAGYDIPRQVAVGDNSDLYTKVFGNDGAYWKRMSPITYAAGPGAPATILHYIEGRAASKMQAEGLAAAILRGGGIAQTHEAKGETHSSINRGFGEAGDDTTRLTLEFLGTHLRGAVTQGQ